MVKRKRMEVWKLMLKFAGIERELQDAKEYWRELKINKGLRDGKGMGKGKEGGRRWGFRVFFEYDCLSSYQRPKSIISPLLSPFDKQSKHHISSWE